MDFENFFGGAARTARKTTRRKSTATRRKSTKTNPWIAHVKKYRKAHPRMSYKTVLVKARASYKPVGGKKVAKRRSTARKSARKSVRKSAGRKPARRSYRKSARKSVARKSAGRKPARRSYRKSAGRKPARRSYRKSSARKYSAQKYVDPKRRAAGRKAAQTRKMNKQMATRRISGGPGQGAQAAAARKRAISGKKRKSAGATYKGQKGAPGGFGFAGLFGADY